MENKKHSTVPKLRFPEFSGEWEEKEVEKIVSYLGGGAFSSTSAVEEGVKWLKIANVGINEIKWNDKSFLPYSFVENNKDLELKVNDIVIALTRPVLNNKLKIARLSESDVPALLNQRVAKIMAKKGNVELFVYYIFQTLRFIRDMQSDIIGTDPPNASFTSMYKQRLMTTSFAEQTKIAEFLSVIDERLELLVEKKKMLEAYKKGVMQKLFSQELRFKDENGNEYTEWENELFGSIYTFYPTNSYSRDCLNMTSGYVKNIHYGDVHVKYKSILNIQDEDIPFINSDIDLTKMYNDHYCQDKDLIIADASEDYADIGKTVEVNKINNQQVVAGLHTILARPNKKEVACCFGGYLMQSENIKLQIKIIAQGTKVLGLSSKRLAKVTLKLPSIAEQQKIANFLFVLDDKITTITNKITYTQQYKKALLQQMFI